MLFESALTRGCGILVLDDDTVLRKRLAAHLRQLDADVSEASTLAETRRLLDTLRFDFALIDLHLPDGDALDLLRTSAFPETTGIVVMTALEGVKPAIAAMRLGAGDYLAKPFAVEELPLAFARCRTLRRSDRRDQHGAATPPAAELFFGHALAPIRAQLETVVQADRRLGQNLPPVLIEGETGTGKTVLARWLHQQGPRADRPFVTVNCAALPDTLADAELFGHERGAFTDAKRARLGLFPSVSAPTISFHSPAISSPASPRATACQI